MLAILPLLLSLPALAHASGVHRLPLTRLKPDNVNHGYEAHALSQKYSGQHTLTTPGAGHNLPLESMLFNLPIEDLQLTTISVDFMNAQYFAEISVGTPPQNVSPQHVVETPF